MQQQTPQKRFGWIDNPLTRALASPRQVDDYIAWLNPLWAIRDTRAQVVGIHHHNEDVVSVALRPGRAWQTHQAGQHVLLGVDIGGVRQQRCFSISSAPVDNKPGDIEITVKRNGVVSSYLVDEAKPGDLVWLGGAEGDFVLPAIRPGRLLFVAGGSGITPLMAMLRQLHQEGYQGDLVFLNFAKSEQSLIFAQALERLRSEMSSIRIVNIFTQQGGRHCDAALLRKEVSDVADREVFLCGPEAMMEVTQRALRDVGVTTVHQERFKLPTASAGDGLVRFQQAGVVAAGDSAGSLLEVAEKAGLEPAYGCRMGICHACTCKVSGRIRDVRNGELKEVAEEDVQICVHAAAGGVTVDI
jgi:ferredoxin-NADP reductase